MSLPEGKFGIVLSTLWGVTATYCLFNVRIDNRSQLIVGENENASTKVISAKWSSSSSRAGHWSCFPCELFVSVGDHVCSFNSSLNRARLASRDQHRRRGRWRGGRSASGHRRPEGGRGDRPHLCADSLVRSRGEYPREGPGHAAAHGQGDGGVGAKAGGGGGGGAGGGGAAQPAHSQQAGTSRPRAATRKPATSTRAVPDAGVSALPPPHRWR